MQVISKFNNLNLNSFAKIAFDLSKNAKLGDIYLLYGDLGVGKTSFVQYFASSMGANMEEINSPTFNLVHQYQCKQGQIWHYDLYRLKEVNEIYELGLRDAFECGITIIEWPEIIETQIPPSATKIIIKILANTELRNITIINEQSSN